MQPPCVLWIDPGKITGLAWLWLTGTGTSFWADEYPFMPAGDHIENTCAHYRGALAIGWERYWVDQRRPQQDAHHALEMIGVARRAGTRYGCRILQPADPHTPNTDERLLLTAAGWWPPGKKDAQSAAWHLYHWCLRTGSLPPAVAAARMSPPAGRLQGRHRDRRH